MGLNLPVPSYSQISRRSKSLHKQINRLIQGKKARHVVFDSTGLKVYGEGEWKVKIHGKTKRRTWRKLHIGIDAETQDILLHCLKYSWLIFLSHLIVNFCPESDYIQSSKSRLPLRLLPG